MSYNHPPRGDVNRLSKWAQEYIGNLKREIERQDRHIKEISSNHPDTNVILNTNIGQPDVTLPISASVRFYLGDNREDYTDCIEFHHSRRDNREIEVVAYGGRFSLNPASGHSVSLRLDNLWPREGK